MYFKFSKIFCCFAILLIAACSSEERNLQFKYPQKYMGRYDKSGRDMSQRETIFGKGGLNLLDEKEDVSRTGIGVNSYLWRASLDTVSFMPVVSADPFGGVIITDWYSMNGINDEKFKLNIYILSKSLRADGIRVTVFRKIKNVNNEWVDADVKKKTINTIENAILTKAREYKISDEIIK